MKKRFTKAKKDGEWVIMAEDEYVVCKIPTFWRNAEAIATKIAESMNKDDEEKLKLLI